MVGETGSTAKIVKVEYRKIDYTYNRLFNFVGSHEKSEYDGELRVTFDSGEGTTTSEDLSYFFREITSRYPQIEQDFEGLAFYV